MKKVTPIYIERRKGYISKQMTIGLTFGKRKLNTCILRYFMVTALNGFVDPICSHLKNYTHNKHGLLINQKIVIKLPSFQGDKSV